MTSSDLEWGSSEQEVEEKHDFKGKTKNWYLFYYLTLTNSKLLVSLYGHYQLTNLPNKIGNQIFANFPRLCSACKKIILFKVIHWKSQ